MKLKLRTWWIASGVLVVLMALAGMAALFGNANPIALALLVLCFFGDPLAARLRFGSGGVAKLLVPVMHGLVALLPVGAAAAIVLVSERDPVLVEPKQAAVGDGDPVRVAGQIGEHRLRASERRLGVDHPALLPDRRQVTQERSSIGKVRHAAGEAELAGIVEREQAAQEQAAEQCAEHPHRQEERRTRGNPALAIQ